MGGLALLSAQLTAFFFFSSLCPLPLRSVPPEISSHPLSLGKPRMLQIVLRALPLAVPQVDHPSPPRGLLGHFRWARAPVAAAALPSGSPDEFLHISAEWTLIPAGHRLLRRQRRKWPWVSSPRRALHVHVQSVQASLRPQFSDES